jgi:hypothetical protein
LIGLSSAIGAIIPLLRSPATRVVVFQCPMREMDRLQRCIEALDAEIRHARPGAGTASPWLLALLERKPRKLAAIALVNRMARIVWAMMERGTAYRPPATTA